MLALLALGPKLAPADEIDGLRTFATILVFGIAALLGACGKRADPPGAVVIVAESARPRDPRIEGPAPEPHLHPVGLWAMSPFVNPPGRATDVNDDPKLSIAPGDAREAFQVRMVPGRSSAGLGRLGSKPRTLVFTDPIGNERFTCAPLLERSDDALLCDNGEPQGFGSTMNPKHRSFLAHRLCGLPGKLRICAAGDADRAPPL